MEQPIQRDADAHEAREGAAYTDPQRAPCRPSGSAPPADCTFPPETLLNTLLEFSSDYIYFKDVDSRFVRCSKALGKLVGHDEEDMIGKTDFDIFGEEHAHAAFEDEQEIIRTGQPMLGKLEKETHSDGSETWAFTSKLAWRDEQGRIIGTFGISKSATALKEAEIKLETLHKQLMKASRTAGMAEVANDVLHNVGNVLNSVNVACSLSIDRVQQGRLSGIGKLAALMEEHGDGLGDFISNDPAGRRIPEYMAGLRDIEAEDRAYLLEELEQLRSNIDHIKRIVTMQQDYAKVAGVTESVSVTELIDDALQINAAALLRHGITTRKLFDEAPPISTDRHKVLQILVNLIRNAKYAMDGRDAAANLLTVRLSGDGDAGVRIQVEDNGEGIPGENMTRIFSHDFTTRKEGHGFGLHSSALAARELGGRLEAHSDGPGRGAVFTLLLPLARQGGNTP